MTLPDLRPKILAALQAGPVDMGALTVAVLGDVAVPTMGLMAVLEQMRETGEIRRCVSPVDRIRPGYALVSTVDGGGQRG